MKIKELLEKKAYGLFVHICIMPIPVLISYDKLSEKAC